MAKESEAQKLAAAEKVAEEAKALAAKEAADAASAAEAAKDEVWDEERGKATILKQRASEAAAIAEAKALKEKLAGYTSEEEAKTEADKLAEVKISERDATIASQDAHLAALEVKYDFMQEAAVQGIADPALAYLAAKEQGYLGEYDAKEREVGAHAWDELATAYPSFKGSGVANTGDAGARSRGKATTVGDQFNKTIRGSL